MDRLVAVDADELELRYNKAASVSSSPRRRCSATFRVTNLMHTMPVAVHITTTRPTSFAFSPNSLAILPPLSSFSFSLFLLPSDSPPPLVYPRDSVTVRSILLTTGKPDAARLLRLFSKPGAVHVFKDAELPISFVGPGVLQSLLPSSSPSSSDTYETTFLLSKAVSGCSMADLTALLRVTAAAGNHHFVGALVGAGADVNARDSDMRSPLSFAIAAGSLETVKLLLDAGSNFDPGIDRFMHEAAANNRVDLMDALAGSVRTAWADVADPAGRTPVHLAVIAGNMEALRFCISSGCGDPDRTDANGWTTLHFAAVGGSSEMVEFLLERCAGYTKHVLTGDGRKTPYELAVNSGHAHLSDALQLGDFMSRAAWSGDVVTIRRCLLGGAEVDRRDQNGWTPLHRAAFKGRLQAVKVLVDQGAQLDAVDDAGYTPLRCAVEAGHADVALCLVANGARVGSKGMRDLVSLAVKMDSCAAMSAATPASVGVGENKGIET